MPSLEHASSADRDQLIALWQECGLTRPWNDPAQDIEKALNYAGSTVLVMRSDDEIIATAMIGYDGHRGWIYYLAVAPAHQGKGHARSIIAACEEWLADLGCAKVEIMVRNGNPAEAMYRRLEWEEQEVAVWGRWLDRDEGAARQ